MAKPPPKRQSDPMSHVVDRLLAQLPGLQNTGVDVQPTNRSSVREFRAHTIVSHPDSPTLIGLWGRVALGLVLGVMMAAWPYYRECGLPLFGYLSAVASVVLAGGWIAVTAWKLRNEVAHILALVLMLWGLALTAEVLLPRTGYAATPAYWKCGEPGSGPTWMRWFGPPAE